MQDSTSLHLLALKRNVLSDLEKDTPLYHLPFIMQGWVNTRSGIWTGMLFIKGKNQPEKDGNFQAVLEIWTLKMTQEEDSVYIWTGT